MAIWNHFPPVKQNKTKVENTQIRNNDFCSRLQADKRARLSKHLRTISLTLCICGQQLQFLACCACFAFAEFHAGHCVVGRFVWKQLIGGAGSPQHCFYTEHPAVKILITPAGAVCDMLNIFAKHTKLITPQDWRGKLVSTRYQLMWAKLAAPNAFHVVPIFELVELKTTGS